MSRAGGEEPGGVTTPALADTQAESVRRCRSCAREVGEDFRFCPYCGKRLASPGTLNWRHSTAALVIAFLLVGPFALPLLWSNPKYRPLTKVLVTVLVLALTVLIVYALVLLTVRVLEQFRGLLRTY